MADQITIPAILMRGGTSKGLFFLDSDLPQEMESKEDIILAALGSPDTYGHQIDGLGSGMSSTSKAVLIRPSSQREVDLYCQFAQVAIKDRYIDYSGFCGNLASAIGIFAVEKNLIPQDKLKEDQIVVSAKTDNCLILSEFSLENGYPKIKGTTHISGVSKAYAPIKVSIIYNSQTLNILPTGQAINIFEHPTYGSIPTSIISAGHPTVFLSANHLPFKLENFFTDNLTELFTLMEWVRSQALIEIGKANTIEEAGQKQGLLKVALIDTPESYTASNGELILRDRHHLRAWIISMNKKHHAFTSSGAISLASAASIPGTIVNEIAKNGLNACGNKMIIGHPSGTMEIEADVSQSQDGWSLIKASYYRTARILMRGEVFIPL